MVMDISDLEGWELRSWVVKAPWNVQQSTPRTFGTSRDCTEREHWMMHKPLLKTLSHQATGTQDHGLVSFLHDGPTHPHPLRPFVMEFREELRGKGDESITCEKSAIHLQLNSISRLRYADDKKSDGSGKIHLCAPWMQTFLLQFRMKCC